VQVDPPRPWFAAGGYVHKLFQSGLPGDSAPRVWNVTISCPRNEVLAAMTVLLVSQVLKGGYPAMSPDVIVVDSDGVETYPGSTTSGRLRYRHELKEANSVCRRCRHYYFKRALHNKQHAVGCLNC
jgi:hypothetical protein